MKKILLFLNSIIISTMAFAQDGRVGIGTSDPKQVFHVDAAKNTSTNDNKTILDDVVVTSTGQMGIGTISPSKKLEIITTTDNTINPNAIKIVDGNQQANAFLQSDANGVGTWFVQGSIKPIELGTWSKSDGILSSDYNGSNANVKSLNLKIELTPGVWMVNFGATFKMNFNTPHWLHIYLSDTNTGRTMTKFNFLGHGGINTGYAGLMIPNKTVGVGNANLISGSSIIEVLEPKNGSKTVVIWVVAENKPNNYWNFKADNWENYFYAVPLDLK